MVGWDNCCHGASAGRPCGIGLTYVWGLGCFVARQWLVDDGLWGHRSVWLVQRAEVGGCMDN